jgi:hypothetical protein
MSSATKARRTRTSCARQASRLRRSATQAIIHDFVMLNALRETHAADAAIKQATRFLTEALGAPKRG